MKTQDLEMARLYAENDNLRQALSNWEEWEARFILNDEVWATGSGLPQFTQKLYDEYIELQKARQAVLYPDKR